MEAPLDKSDKYILLCVCVCVCMYIDTAMRVICIFSHGIEYRVVKFHNYGRTMLSLSPVARGSRPKFY
ncbi:hypothetical protein CISIN_1g039823mg [Citrus sinensis]|uniref:Uncharacterized protein n=1 Tax=Citrus sinensis TaxID=2711 RepID=A0A067G291_CITSI|nr:hypothetical protein CISIN_1g039823mg [Citrus sinensis]